jgi:DNA-3-methyladenine glycosylase I
MEKLRCPWAGTDPDYQRYHDEEWGVPLRDDHALFELLILEGAQAGLSWLTILRRRESYRRAFEGFDAARIARYSEKDTARLLADPGIIRNRRKVASAIGNAQAFLAIREEHGSFSDYLWNFVDGKPVVNRWESISEVPARTKLSDRMSKDLKDRGFSFVGSVIVYSFLQSAGLVNDHLVSCFRWKAVSRKGR